MSIAQGQLVAALQKQVQELAARVAALEKQAKPPARTARNG